MVKSNSSKAESSICGNYDCHIRKLESEGRAIEQAASRGVLVEGFLESVIEESLNGGEDPISYQGLEGNKEW